MAKNEQMIVLSVLFGVAVALVSIYAQEALLPVTMVGGALVGLGWAFYVERDGDS